jgi:hypothetical protein
MHRHPAGSDPSASLAAASFPDSISSLTGLSGLASACSFTFLKNHAAPRFIVLASD